MDKILILVFLSLFSLFHHGYQFAVSDQEIFIPYILKATDDNLFKGDLLFDQSSSILSLFYPIYGALNRLFDLQLLFFGSYITFQFIFFLAIYNFSKTLIKDKNIAYLSLFPFLIPKFIGGTATLTYDVFFGYRSIGVIFLILFLNALFEKKIIKSIFIAFIGLIFHLLSIIPNIFIGVSLFFEKFKYKLNFINKKMFIASALFLILILIFLTLNIFPNDDVWLSIIKSRDDYLFLSTWGLKGWASFFMYITVILLLLKKLQSSVRKTILLFLSISLTVFTATYFILEILRIPAIAQFQLTRSITPLAYIALSISPLLLCQQNIYLKITGFVAFLSLSLNYFSLLFISIVAFIFLSTFQKGSAKSPKISSKFVQLASAIIIFLSLVSTLSNGKNIRSNIQFPKEKNDWINLQIWAKSNTNPSDVFLVPPDQTGFRIFSERPIIGDIKDGAVVIYDKSYAQRWYELLTDFTNYSTFDDNKFTELAGKYNFDFIVTSYNHQLKFETVYKNKSYIIYKFK